MAVAYKDIRDGLLNAPLTNDELNIIAKVENFIDERIKERFDGSSISFETKVLDFNFNPDNPKEFAFSTFKDIKTTRKQLMKKELMRRFEVSGWEWKLEEGEDDGPNRPAIDYWLLKGKF